jgi:hypothetical protein
MSTRKSGGIVEAAVGYAADGRGSGVAYAAVSRRGRGGPAVLRVPFRVRRYPALLEREVGYAALTAVAGVLLDRGVRRVRLGVNDPELVSDLSQRRPVPVALSLPYVRLGCLLNQFAEHEVVPVPDRDLHARARAETALSTAA